MSARRLLIVLMNTDPRNPEELGAPFYYAAVATAMDHPVDALCTATAGKLMLKGVAELLTRDAFGEGWMLIVRPAGDDWRAGLVTGAAIGPTIERWIAGGSYKERTG
jgi:predicted peroxiredoxin